MNYSKKLFICCALLCAAGNLFAQNTKAPINYSWSQYATDTDLTFRQIVTTCDSLFALAGFPGRDTASNEREGDDNPYYDYLKWKAFWAPRLDAPTGKLHDLSKNMPLPGTATGRTTSVSLSNTCNGYSVLQDSLGTVIPNGLGWHFIGPQNVTGSAGELPNNSVDQHLGRVNSICVNPHNQNEVYVASDWGGIWKTTNANLAPNNTWTCITDHDHGIAGRGASNLIVDFTPGVPHRIFCTFGYPDRSSYFYNMQETIGLFYTVDNGSDMFRYLWGGESINDIKLYPGSHLLFMATHFKIIQLDVTGPWNGTTAPVTSTVITDMLPYLPTDGSAGGRFRGFSNLVFKPSDPRRLFFSSISNYGQYYPQTAHLYRYDIGGGSGIKDMTNSFGVQDVVTDGNFATTAIGKSYWFYTSGLAPAYTSWGWTSLIPGTSGTMDYYPAYGQVASLETAVEGTYIGSMTYVVTFTLTLPAYTQVNVVLRDAIVQNGPDYGSGTPVMGPDINVGPGIFSGPPTGPPVTTTYTVTVTANHFVDRLEFAAQALSILVSSPIRISNVHVLEASQHYIFNLTTSTAVSAANDVYCMTQDNVDMPSTVHVKKIRVNDVSPWPACTTTIVDRQITPGGGFGMVVSPSNPDYIYFFSPQSAWGPLVAKIFFPGPVVITPTWDATSTNNHPDARSLVAMPNGTGSNDNIFLGDDGGISYKNGYNTGTWKSLNGTGLTTSLANSIGTNLHTGDVSIATGDNGILTTNTTLQNYTKWTHILPADGYEIKYGRRYLTRNEMFWGWDGGGSFANLQGITVGLPTVNGLPNFTVSGIGMSKLKTTYRNEYFGTSHTANVGEIYNVKITGTTTYTGTWNCLTCGSTLFSHKPVMAIAPDMYNGDYIAAYVCNGFWEPGVFAFTHNATTGTPPTWDTVSCSRWDRILDMAVDPRSSGTTKRMWAGCGWYNDHGRRVLQSVDDGHTWNDYSIGLPSGPVNALVYDEQSHVLFAGGDMGIYFIKVDKGPIGIGSNVWSCYSMNLPSSFVTGLDINRCTGKLYAATWGRGAYEADLPHDWNWNGTGIGGFTDTCDIDLITGTTIVPTLWQQDKDEVRTIYIGAGKSLHIQGCTLNMGRNKNIIVAPGGTLVVDKATITNTCGQMWGCISVLGDPTVAQVTTNIYAANPSSNQGLVVLKNNSVIEHAFYGLKVGAVYYDGTDGPMYTSGQEGGLVIANNTKFHNCGYDAEFHPYKFPQNSLFNNCTFLADDSIPNAHYTDYTAGATTPRKYGTKEFVISTKNYGLTITNCTFETLDNTTAPINFHPAPDLRGIGYEGFRSSATIDNCT
ncbi:MAG: hypothetical protein ACHQD8_05390, partial [Chitinophagales bacterium]